MTIHEDGTIEFANGHKVKTLDGYISLVDGWVCSGATESIYDPKARPDTPLYLSPEERVELGEYMIGQWLEFTEKAKGTEKAEPISHAVVYKDRDDAGRAFEKLKSILAQKVHPNTIDWSKVAISHESEPPGGFGDVVPIYDDDGNLQNGECRVGCWTYRFIAHYQP